jgi:phosphoenolpyruvate carboxylase
VALRTLEVYTSATLDAALSSPAPVRPEWHETMERLAAAAQASFRQVVYDDPRFLSYYRAVTPEAELDGLHIGSRPARRGSAAGLAGLRAIPWQFAWMQTRLLLASWLGAEELDGAGLSDADRAVLPEMYREWPFFRSLVDLLQMTLAKADPQIAAQYDRQLAPPDLQPLAESLRAKLLQATRALLAITGQDALLTENDTLRRSIEVRNPYVDPINLVQIELLRRLAVLREAQDRGEPATGEAHECTAAVLRKALRVTISGVAAGMRNTG